MNAYVHSAEKTGILRITGGTHSDERLLPIKADLEDLPGVHSVEATKEGVRVRFNPDLVSEQQFYEAVKVAGFHASDFATLLES